MVLRMNMTVDSVGRESRSVHLTITFARRNRGATTTHRVLSHDIEIDASGKTVPRRILLKIMHERNGGEGESSVSMKLWLLMPENMPVVEEIDEHLQKEY
jgi:SH3-like domain-containing protein